MNPFDAIRKLEEENRKRAVFWGVYLPSGGWQRNWNLAGAYDTREEAEKAAEDIRGTIPAVRPAGIPEVAFWWERLPEAEREAAAARLGEKMRLVREYLARKAGPLRGDD